MRGRRGVLTTNYVAGHREMLVGALDAVSRGVHGALRAPSALTVKFFQWAASSVPGPGATSAVIDTSEMQAGDLVFCWHEGGVWYEIQRPVLNTWGHMGVVAELDGELRVIELVRGGKAALEVDAFVASRWVGVARPARCNDCRKALQLATHDEATRETAYSHIFFVLVTLGLLTVRIAPGLHRWASHASVSIEDRLAHRRPRHDICSGPAVRALAALGPCCRLEIDNFSPSDAHRWNRSRTEPLRIFSAPSSIWRAIPSTHRFLLAAPRPETAPMWSDAWHEATPDTHHGRATVLASLGD